MHRTRIGKDFSNNMNEALLEVKDLTMRFGGVTALHELSFAVKKNEICGLIGPNGAGKTTLFNVISRIYDPTTGSINFQNETLLNKASYQIAQMGIARTFQNLALWPKMTVLENVMAGAHVHGKQNYKPGCSPQGGCMSKSSRYEWRDQQAALQERMKGFLANPGNEQLEAMVAEMRAYAQAAQSGQIEIPQSWTSYS